MEKWTNPIFTYFYQKNKEHTSQEKLLIRCIFIVEQNVDELWICGISEKI